VARTGLSREFPSLPADQGPSGPGVGRRVAKKPRRSAAYEALFSDLGNTLLRSTPRRRKPQTSVEQSLRRRSQHKSVQQVPSFLGLPKIKSPGRRWARETLVRKPITPETPCPLQSLLEALGRNLYHVHFEIISNIIGAATVIRPSPSETSRPKLALNDW
jgi:hypothetical protein